MFTLIFRIIKFAGQDFFRNFWLSVVTLTILVLALFSVNLLIIFNTIADSAIATIENKIDINVYFKPEISEEQVQNVQKYLESLVKVEAVQYTSRDQALANFKERYQDNQKIMQSLAELDKNPLGASLAIKAKDTSDYPQILESLADPQYDALIERKDFDDHKQVISRITGITQKVNFGVAGVAVIFILIAILIIANAIRMAIYTHREEIYAMKLVGATNWFVRGPFLLQGLIFAVLSVFLTIVVVYPLLGLLQPWLGKILENDFNIINFFNANFGLIFGLQLLVAMLINLISSYWAVNKYLSV